MNYILFSIVCLIPFASGCANQQDSSPSLPNESLESGIEVSASPIPTYDYSPVVPNEYAIPGRAVVSYTEAGNCGEKPPGEPES